MALFGKLFEKKNCEICGKELGLFGKTKIAEGYICKECDGKLSPYFTAYRSATADDIRAQLAYREGNKAEVAAFHVTRTLGNNTKVYVDEDQSKVIITNAEPSNWGERNPDVLEFSQITGCNDEVRETRTEIKRTDAEGNEVSYNPPRYDIDYDIYITVYVSHPYVGQIQFKVNRNRIETRGSAEYRQSEQLAREIKDALSGIRSEQRAAAVPKTPVTCPNCLANTVPDDTGCCPYCGSSLASVISVPQQEQDTDERASYDRRDDDRQGYGERDYRGRGYGDRDYRERDYGERDYGERDYGERDYGEIDYGEGRSQNYRQQTAGRGYQQGSQVSQARPQTTAQSRQQAATTSRQTAATGPAKADFRHQQAAGQQGAGASRQTSATGAAKADFRRQQATGQSQQQAKSQSSSRGAGQSTQQRTGTSGQTKVTGKAKEDFRRNQNK